MTHTGYRKTRANQILNSHVACHQVAMDKSSLLKEEVDRLFAIEVHMSGQKIKLPPTPEVISGLRQLFKEV